MKLLLKNNPEDSSKLGLLRNLLFAAILYAVALVLGIILGLALAEAEGGWLGVLLVVAYFCIPVAIIITGVCSGTTALLVFF